MAPARADEPAGESEATAPALPQVIVEAPEPRYVAPTRWDRIGRIWAPVLINDRGPFRLVLDTGASRSAINASVAAALGIDLSNAATVMLLGVTGELEVSAVTVESFVVGDLELRPARLPIIADAFGGAEGVLGTDGLLDKRILIDFRHDSITISRSHGERQPRGFVTLPVQIVGGLIIISDARFGSLPVQAIVDTGGQSSIANAALGEALRRRIHQPDRGASEITGVTLDVSARRSGLNAAAHARRSESGYDADYGGGHLYLSALEDGFETDGDDWHGHFGASRCPDHRLPASGAAGKDKGPLSYQIPPRNPVQDGWCARIESTSGRSLRHKDLGAG